MTLAAEIETLVQEAVDHVNADLSRFEQIKRFAILPRDFTAEDGEVTPTLKLKRRVCAEHSRREIEKLYARARGSAARRRTSPRTSRSGSRS